MPLILTLVQRNWAACGFGRNTCSSRTTVVSLDFCREQLSLVVAKQDMDYGL